MYVLLYRPIDGLFWLQPNPGSDVGGRRWSDGVQRRKREGPCYARGGSVADLGGGLVLGCCGVWRVAIGPTIAIYRWSLPIVVGVTSPWIMPDLGRRRQMQ